MKIITWNCNMAFRKKWPAILKYNPDILVLQECEHPSKYKPAQKILNYNQFLWYGENENKGVGILAFNDYQIKFDRNHNKDFKYILPVKVTRNDSTEKYNLFAIWAMPIKNSPSKSYCFQIWEAIHFYKRRLNNNSILIGDFNSNSIWDHKKKVGNHVQIVDFLLAKNIVSIYHQQEKELHGEELQPTLFLLKNKQKPYHIDYCFVSNNLISRQTKLEVGRYEDWIKLSDHMPVIVELF